MTRPFSFSEAPIDIIQIRAPVSLRLSISKMESNMTTKTQIQYSTVPSFRRRLKRLCIAVQRAVYGRAQPDIPPELRRDLGFEDPAPRSPRDRSDVWRHLP